MRLATLRKIPGAPELEMRNPTYLDAVAIYRGRFAGCSPTDELRRLAASKNYHWRALVSPDVTRQTVPSQGTIEDQFTVAPGSFITAISGYSAQAAGFTIQVTDAGSGQKIAQIPITFLAGFGGANATSKFPNRPLPMYLPSLFPVSQKGLVLVSIVNTATVANALAVCIQIAEKH